MVKFEFCEMWWLIGSVPNLMGQRSRVQIRHLLQWSWGAAGSLWNTVKISGYRGGGEPPPKIKQNKQTKFLCFFGIRINVYNCLQDFKKIMNLFIFLRYRLKMVFLWKDALNKITNFNKCRQNVGGSELEISLAKPPSDKKKKEDMLRKREQRMMRSLTHTWVLFVNLKVTVTKS